MLTRVLIAAAAVVVALLMIGVSDDARRDTDRHRSAQIAGERLDAALHGVAALDRRANEGVHVSLLAGDLRIELARGREAGARLLRLRPDDPAVRAAVAAARRHADGTARRIVLDAHGRRAAALRLDRRVVEPAYAAAAPRLDALLDELARRGDSAYRRGGLVLWSGLGAGVVLLLGLCATFLGASRRAASERAQRRRAALAERTSDVVTLVGPDGVVRWQSASAARLFLRDADAVGAPVASLFDEAGAARATEAVARLLAQPDATVSFTATVSGADGKVRGFETLAENRLADREIRALVLTSRDVTDRVQLEDELRRRAFHDGLTGLPNRALFEDRLQHALAAARRDGPLAVMFLDLDDFKTVNDSLGHAAGDELLRLAAARIDSVLRPGDTVARLGGDEFAVLLERVGDAGTTEAVAGRIVEALRGPVTIGERRLAVRTSVGIAMSHPGATVGDLLRDADIAMYAAKTRGDGRWAIFDPSMHADAIMRLELSAELPAAIERGELELHYQPIVGLDGRPTGGAEALVRWRHPRRGLLAPGAFIELAESTGAIVALGRWVIEQACADVARWQREAGAARLFVSVNVSQAQLADDAFVDHVEEALARSGLAPSALMLELTESLLARDPDAVVERLRRLRALGVRTAIDDFGTGHSALSLLRQLPVDVLKLDRSFIGELASQPESARLLAGVVQLGRSLGLELIAEGVERPEQARALMTLGAMSAQGFLYARPMPARELQFAPHLGIDTDGSPEPAAGAPPGA